VKVRVTRGYKGCKKRPSVKKCDCHAACSKQLSVHEGRNEAWARKADALLKPVGGNRDE